MRVIISLCKSVYLVVDPVLCNKPATCASNVSFLVKVDGCQLPVCVYWLLLCSSMSLCNTIFLPCLLYFICVYGSANLCVVCGVCVCAVSYTHLKKRAGKRERERESERESWDILIRNKVCASIQVSLCNITTTLGLSAIYFNYNQISLHLPRFYKPRIEMLTMK